MKYKLNVTYLVAIIIRHAIIKLENKFDENSGLECRREQFRDYFVNRLISFLLMS